MKQMRRGPRGGRGDALGYRGGRGGFQEARHPFPPAGSPLPTPNFSNGSHNPLSQNFSFDANDPMAAMIAIQAMGLPPLPGMPQLPQLVSPNGNHQFGGPTLSSLNGSSLKERCKDYDVQGYCARGDSCPYEHGTDRLIAPSQDGRDQSTLTELRR